jgi:hypothetical protein
LVVEFQQRRGPIITDPDQRPAQLLLLLNDQRQVGDRRR